LNVRCDITTARKVQYAVINSEDFFKKKMLPFT
jgi:hypothetical protein